MNKIQELNLELIRANQFNDFNGQNVYDDLKHNEDKWEAVIMDRGKYCFGGHGDWRHMIDLIKLRDLASGYWNVDTLFVIPKDGKEDDLEALARGWKADEVDYMEEDEVNDLLGGNSAKKRVLRVWWD